MNRPFLYPFYKFLHSFILIVHYLLWHSTKYFALIWQLTNIFKEKLYLSFIPEK